MPRLPSIDLHGHDNGKLNQSRWPQMSGKTFNEDNWWHMALTSSRVYSTKLSRSKSSVMVKWLTFALLWQSETQEELFCEWHLMWNYYDWAWTIIFRRNQLVNSEEDLQSCAHNVCYGSTCIFLHLEYPNSWKKHNHYTQWYMTFVTSLKSFWFLSIYTNRLTLLDTNKPLAMIDSCTPVSRLGRGTKKSNGFWSFTKQLGLENRDHHGIYIYTITLGDKLSLPSHLVTKFRYKILSGQFVYLQILNLN